MAGTDDIYKINKRLYESAFASKTPPKAVTGTSAITPDAGQYFEAIQIVTANTTVASITINGTAFTQFAGVSLPSGFVFYGVITSITLGTGTALAYQFNANSEGLNG